MLDSDAEPTMPADEVRDALLGIAEIAADAAVGLRQCGAVTLPALDALRRIRETLAALPGAAG